MKFKQIFNNNNQKLINNKKTVNGNLKKPANNHKELFQQCISNQSKLH